jgi:hypothetical protein
MLSRELVIRDLVQTAANYAATYSVTLAGATQWSAYATSNPIGDVKTARLKVHSGLFLHINTAIIPYEVMSQLEDHPDFIERIKYSERGIVTPELIAALFQLDRIIVPGVGLNTARMGQTEALGYLWGKDVVLAYVPPRAGPKVPAFMYEFTWRYPGGQRQVVERWREQHRGRDVIRVRRRYSHKFMAVNASGLSIAGYVIKAAVA